MHESPQSVGAPVERERQLIYRLVDTEFAGAVALRQQLARSEVYVQQYPGALILRFKTPAEAPRAEVLYRVPVEATAPDLDGIPIHVLLHVVDGLLHEVEIFREDSQPIQRVPDASTVTIETL